MDGDRPAPDRALVLGKTVATFGAAWTFAILSMKYAGRLNHADHATQKALYKILGGFPAAARYADILYTNCVHVFGETFGVTLFFATGLAVLGAAARMVARARVRAGQADFLDRLRAFTAARPKGTRALVLAPAIAWTLLQIWPGPWELENPWAYFEWVLRGAAPMIAAAWGVTALTRKGLRELLAPTEPAKAGEGETSFAIDPDEIVFDAVAVTRESLTLVALFTLITLAVPTFIWTRPILDLFQKGSIGYVVAAYIAFAISGALAFRRASRVAVGVDGVHIRGTSRARFFAYRDIDRARANGSDLELVRRGKVVLRLQLHGEDAARRGAVLARITEHLELVRLGRGATAAQIVHSSSKDELARAMDGAGDYRIATLTREQLWALVEGPEIEASARRAAAEALVRSQGDSERKRLRVAAERCAEPQVRIALEQIAATGAEDDEAQSKTSTPLFSPSPHAPHERIPE